MFEFICARTGEGRKELPFLALLVAALLFTVTPIDDAGIGLREYGWKGHRYPPNVSDGAESASDHTTI